MEAHGTRTVLPFPPKAEVWAEAEGLARGYGRLYPGVEELPHPRGRYLTTGLRHLLLKVEKE